MIASEHENLFIYHFILVFHSTEHDAYDRKSSRYFNCRKYDRHCNNNEYAMKKKQTEIQFKIQVYMSKLLDH